MGIKLTRPDPQAARGRGVARPYYDTRKGDLEDFARTAYE